jgi:RimJ/RimL family protein N-acetyltransferase
MNDDRVSQLASRGGPLQSDDLPHRDRTSSHALRTRDDAAWNLELLGEHEGGTSMTINEAEQRLVEQKETAQVNGIGLLTIRRRDEGDPVGYCGLIVGRSTFDEPEIAYEFLRRFRGRGLRH